MADESFVAKITPITGPVDPDYGKPEGPGYGGGTPMPPIYLPPSPWPPPGEIELPIALPPSIWDPTYPTPPIVITPPPDKPNPIPPGEVWPPLDPIYVGKLVAIVVVGSGEVHWYHVPPPSVPGTPQPKRG